MDNKRKNFSSNVLADLLFIALMLYLIVIAIVASVYILLPVIILLLAWKIYECAYFKGKKFLEIKSRSEAYIKDCNDLNQHIEELKDTQLIGKRTDAGRSDYRNESRWNVRRSALNNQEYGSNIHNCSLAVCDGARREPFKYVCKYFNIQANEETLSMFESILNNFEAAEDGKTSLKAEKEAIIESVSYDIPFLIQTFSKSKLEKNLGFEPVNLSKAYYPRYTFKYVSPGGNKATRYDIIMDLNNLNGFVKYLSEKVKFKKSIAGQRALMTSKLREKIKSRDGYACRKCGISVAAEPHLLLEIDHIVPVSRGGLTAEDNLQTLCWKCNRSKGAKT